GSVSGLLNLSSNASSIKYIRVSNAKTAIGIGVPGNTWAISHAQFVNCQYGMFDSASVTSTLHNVLFYKVSNLSTSSLSCFYGDHVTLNQVTNGNNDTVTLTNSLFTATSGFSGGASNAYVSSSAGVFQTVGAASHYLADNSPY